jgi:hypothetical protein
MAEGKLKMKLLLDENGNVVVRNGKPVYVHDDGKEVEFDAPGTINTITRLNKEAQTHREAKEAETNRVKELETQIKVFEGLDPEAARKALETVGKIADGKLIDSGKVDEVRNAVGKTYEEKIAAMTGVHTSELAKMKAENEALAGHLNTEIIGGNFARSKVIQEKLAIPADLVQAAFGKAFKVVDGKLVAVDASGNTMYSRNRPGEVANFDEALEMLVDQYPNRDHILKASGASGSGASAAAGRGGSGSGNKGISRDDFAKLDPAAKMAHIKAGNAITD